MPDVTHWVQAQPLTTDGFAPYGQVVGLDDLQIDLRDDEVFHLNILSYEHKPIRVDHINRHHKATQALVPMGGRPAVIVVGGKDLTFDTIDDLAKLQAFILDGTRGINLALGTWHEGPLPLMERVDLLNLQGKHFENDNEVAYFERDLGAVVGVRL